ncbi:MAG: hypothetical protein RJQ21_13865 [Rhodospirillales bacterium]
MSDNKKSDPDKKLTSGERAADERRARQAAALRDNLRRRKQQARAQAGEIASGTEEQK